MFKRTKKTIASLVFLTTLGMPFLSFAHDAYFLQVLVDTTQQKYSGNIVNDDLSGLNLKTENDHTEAKLGDFSKLGNTASSSASDLEINVPTDIKTDKSNYPQEINKGTDPMMFTFPSKGSGVIASWGQSATEKDANRVYAIKEQLIPGINDALKILNGGQPFKTTQDLVTMSGMLARGEAPSGYTITYGARASNQKSMPSVDGTSLNESDFVKITHGNQEYEFVYRVQKGYQAGEPLYNKDLNDIFGYTYSGDTEYITWQMLIYQGNYNLITIGSSAADASTYTKPGALESALTGVLSSVLNSVRDILGLYGLDELVYSNGVRGSSAWVFGIMPKDWMDNAIVYQWIFQAIAWSLILLAMVRMFILKSTSTTNSFARVSLLDMTKDLLITGFLLGSLIPFLNLVMFMNGKTVGLFHFFDGLDQLSRMNNYSSFLGGVILQFFYFAVMLYFNFVYTMRAITITILTASAPMFVVSLAFGPKYNHLFGTWLKEIVSSVFLQSFHAFVLGLFLVVSTGARGIESLVLCMALIPLTEWFRSLFFKNSGGIAGALGMQSLTSGMAIATGAMKGSGAKTRGGKGGKGGKGGSTEEGVSTGGKENGGISEHLQGDDGSATSQGVIMENRGITQNAQDSIETPVDKLNDSSFQPKISSIPNGTSNGRRASVLSSSKKALMGAGKVGLGVGKMAVGVGAGLAMGSQGAKIMQDMAVSGAGTIGEGASEFSKGAVKAGGEMLGHPIEKMQEIAHQSDIAKANPQSSEIYAERLSNGDVQIHHDSALLEKEGILGAYEDSSGNAVYTYDRDKLSNNDQVRLDSYEGVFSNGDTEEIDGYKKMGVERVSYNKAGNLMVAYNKAGKEKMGISSVCTVGNGANKRVIETKKSNQPWQTARTI